MHIYVVTNLVNSKCYVGQTILNPPTQRWKDHLKVSRQQISKNDMLITRAIRKYGSNAFAIEYYKLHSGSSQNLLNQMECLAIAKYNSMRPNGYNVREGGSKGKHSEITKQKLSSTLTGVSQGTSSKAHALAISKAKKGISNGPMSQSHKDAISVGLIGTHRGPKSQSHKDAISIGIKRFHAQKRSI